MKLLMVVKMLVMVMMMIMIKTVRCLSSARINISSDCVVFPEKRKSAKSCHFKCVHVLNTSKLYKVHEQHQRFVLKAFSNFSLPVSFKFVVVLKSSKVRQSRHKHPAFVLVNDLFSGFSLFLFWTEMRTILFLLLLVSFCCMHLYFTAVSYQMFFH